MDNQYYQSLVRDYFKDKKIKIYKTRVDTISFTYTNGVVKKLMRKNLEEANWGGILFNMKDSPVIINGTSDFKEEVNKYFKW